MNWVTIDELLVIHGCVIGETGGVPGVINSGALQSAVERPFTSFGGQALYATLVDKIAALIHSVVAFHPFADGNKRTALVAGDVALRLNGLCLVPSADVEPSFWSIARGERDVGQIAAWLTAHTKPVTPSPSGESP
jgi:death-on-curing protein